MAPPKLFDTSHVDFSKLAHDVSVIEATNPHRGDMRMLDGIVWESEDHLQAIAVKHVGSDEFWVPGHIPGRPIFPGVLMVEAGAQLASFMTMNIFDDLEFVGFGGVTDVKFRGQVAPGDTLYIYADGVNIKRRRAICMVQGYVNDQLVFEARITGMPF